MTDLAPIVFFVYNRPKHTETVLNALKKNTLAKDSLLYVFSDAAKKEKDFENVNKVREIINKINGFKEVIISEAETNIGCADSIISGITKVINEHGKAIIVEDDILTAPNFLEFMNEALNKYENDRRIFSISGYNVPMQIPENWRSPVFLTYRYSSWGWATWKDRWNEADWDVLGWQEIFTDKTKNKLFRRGGDDLPYILRAQMNGTIDAWDIRWYYSHYSRDRFTVFPTYSLVENIGFDGSGIHCGNAGKAPNKPVIAQNGDKINLPDTLEFNEEMNKLFISRYKYTFKDKLRRFLKELLRYKINK